MRNQPIWAARECSVLVHTRAPGMSGGRRSHPHYHPNGHWLLSHSGVDDDDGEDAASYGEADPPGYYRVAPPAVARLEEPSPASAGSSRSILRPARDLADATRRLVDVSAPCSQCGRRDAALRCGGPCGSGGSGGSGGGGPRYCSRACALSHWPTHHRECSDRAQ